MGVRRLQMGCKVYSPFVRTPKEGYKRPVKIQLRQKCKVHATVPRWYHCRKYFYLMDTSSDRNIFCSDRPTSGAAAYSDNNKLSERFVTKTNWQNHFLMASLASLLMLRLFRSPRQTSRKQDMNYVTVLVCDRNASHCTMNVVCHVSAAQPAAS